MTVILADHDIEGQAYSLIGVLGVEGWLEVVDLRLTTFAQVGLSFDSSDRVVWRFAQENGMILLTNNRNMDSADSLEQTLREENTPTSLPIVTIANVGRLSEKQYRERCAFQLLEIVLELQKHLGRSRVYIPFK
ncbi:MAG: ACP S-malonyltransferase [Anaerolinea sp.]|nr:ACP S-malonyltransferase [Anaerolinea sp.]